MLHDPQYVGSGYQSSTALCRHILPAAATGTTGEPPPVDRGGATDGLQPIGDVTWTHTKALYSLEPLAPHVNPHTSTPPPPSPPLRDTADGQGGQKVTIDPQYGPLEQHQGSTPSKHMPHMHTSPWGASHHTKHRKYCPTKRPKATLKRCLAGRQRPTVERPLQQRKNGTDTGKSMGGLGRSMGVVMVLKMATSLTDPEGWKGGRG